MRSDEGVPATSAFLFGPEALAFDPKGNLIVGELGTGYLTILFPTLSGMIGNQIPRIGARLRRITPDGSNITTVAGDGTTVMNNPDDDDVLVSPVGLAFDLQGRLAIADGGANQLKLLPLP